MLFNTVDVKRITLATLSLIIFWIALKYRALLFQSLEYVPSFKNVLPQIIILWLISLLLDFYRWFSMLRSMGYDFKIWEGVKIHLLSASANLSMIKFSDSIKVALLKKKGVRASQGVVIYTIERFLDASLASLLLIVFLGKRTGLWFVLLFLVLSFVIAKNRKKVYRGLKGFKWVEQLEEGVESAIKSMKRLGNVQVLSTVILSTIVSTLTRCVAFKLLTGADLYTAIEAISVIGGGSAAVAPTQGGVGVWEVAVISFMSGYISPAQAVAAVLVHRLLFFWAPAILGGILWLVRE